MEGEVDGEFSRLGPLEDLGAFDLDGAENADQDRKRATDGRPAGATVAVRRHRPSRPRADSLQVLGQPGRGKVGADLELLVRRLVIRRPGLVQGNLVQLADPSQVVSEQQGRLDSEPQGLHRDGTAVHVDGPSGRLARATDHRNHAGTRHGQPDELVALGLPDDPGATHRWLEPIRRPPAGPLERQRSSTPMASLRRTAVDGSSPRTETTDATARTWGTASSPPEADQDQVDRSSPGQSAQSRSDPPDEPVRCAWVADDTQNAGRLEVEQRFGGRRLPPVRSGPVPAAEPSPGKVQP